jgi:hypothetical protein
MLLPVFAALKSYSFYLLKYNQIITMVYFLFSII